MSTQASGYSRSVEKLASDKELFSDFMYRVILRSNRCASAGLKTKSVLPDKALELVERAKLCTVGPNNEQGTIGYSDLRAIMSFFNIIFQLLYGVRPEELSARGGVAKDRESDRKGCVVLLPTATLFVSDKYGYRRTGAKSRISCQQYECHKDRYANPKEVAGFVSRLKECNKKKRCEIIAHFIDRGTK